MRKIIIFCFHEANHLVYMSMLPKTNKKLNGISGSKQNFIKVKRKVEKQMRSLGRHQNKIQPNLK